MSLSLAQLCPAHHWSWDSLRLSRHGRLRPFSNQGSLGRLLPRARRSWTPQKPETMNENQASLDRPTMDPARAAEVSGVVAEKMQLYRKDESGWKTCRSGKGVTISWRPSTEFPGNLYKGEGIIYGTPEEVWKFLAPADNGLRAKWDDNVKDFQVLESIKDDLFITRTITPSAVMKLISPRDFIDLVLVKKYDDGTISSNATYVDYLPCPPQSGYVRGFNHPCGCFCEPVPGETNKTHVVSFFQTDLSGYLPQNVVNSFFPNSMAEFYNNLQKAVNKQQE